MATVGEGVRSKVEVTAKGRCGGAAAGATRTFGDERAYWRASL